MSLPLFHPLGYLDEELKSREVRELIIPQPRSNLG